MSHSPSPHTAAHCHTLHLAVKVVPGAARTAVVGMLGETIKIRVAAAPEDGAANKVLLRFVQNRLGAVEVVLVSGGAARHKLLKCHFAQPAPTLAQAYTLLSHAP